MNYNRQILNIIAKKLRFLQLHKFYAYFNMNLYCFNIVRISILMEDKRVRWVILVFNYMILPTIQKLIFYLMDKSNHPYSENRNQQVLKAPLKPNIPIQ